MIVSKKFEFEASHQLPDVECYGACRNLHGHTYKLEVGVSGEINDKGWVINFKDLKTIVNDVVIKVFDHAHLNKFFTISTAEVMGQWIFNKVEEALVTIPEDVHVSHIKLYETTNSYAYIDKYKVLDQKYFTEEGKKI